jgi:hypothetical protein
MAQVIDEGRAVDRLKVRAGPGGAVPSAGPQRLTGTGVLNGVAKAWYARRSILSLTKVT